MSGYVTRDEFAATLRARIEYHAQINDDRVAGALRLVLEELESVNGLPENAPPPDRLLGLEEAAELMGVTPRWLRDNRPPYLVRLSPRELRVSLRQLERFLQTVDAGA